MIMAALSRQAVRTIVTLAAFLFGSLALLSFVVGNYVAGMAFSAAAGIWLQLRWIVFVQWSKEVISVRQDMVIYTIDRMAELEITSMDAYKRWVASVAAEVGLTVVFRRVDKSDGEEPQFVVQFLVGSDRN